MTTVIPLSFIDIAGLAVSLGVLAIASINDLKTREVSNRFWIIYAPISILIFILRVFDSTDIVKALTDFSIPAGATIIVAFLLFQFGIMGGADSKALMCLGFTIPVAPTFMGPLWKVAIPSFYPFPIAVLINSFILSIGSVVILFTRNLGQRLKVGKDLFRGFEKESIVRKLLIMVTCYKTSFNILESKPYLFPAEQVELVDTEPVRHFHVISDADTDRDKLVSGLQNYKDRGLFTNGVWVTPGLPHLVFITASLIVTVFLGDLLMLMFLKIMGVS